RRDQGRRHRGRHADAPHGRLAQGPQGRRAARTSAPRDQRLTRGARRRTSMTRNHP
ncbi:MAG: hypothetical protein ACYC1W_03125, partial [Gemmatimonadaceae bacterium]